MWGNLKNFAKLGGIRDCEHLEVFAIVYTCPTPFLAPRLSARAPARIRRRLHSRQLCGVVRRRQRRSRSGRPARPRTTSARRRHTATGATAWRRVAAAGRRGRRRPRAPPPPAANLRISCANRSQSRGAVSSGADAEEAGEARGGAAGGRRGPRARSDATSSWSATRPQP